MIEDTFFLALEHVLKNSDRAVPRKLQDVLKISAAV